MCPFYHINEISSIHANLKEISIHRKVNQTDRLRNVSDNIDYWCVYVIMYGGIHNYHHFHKRTNRMLGGRGYDLNVRFFNVYVQIMTKTKCPLIARSLILTQGRGKDGQNEKKIVLELFACMLVIHQNDALLRNMATVKHTVIIFNIYICTLSRGRGG